MACCGSNSSARKDSIFKEEIEFPEFITDLLSHNLEEQ